MSDPEPVLNYRPPKPKVSRQKISPWRCLAYTCLASGIAIGCAITWFLGKAAIGAVDSIRHPHRAHHYNATQYAIDGDQSVVYPILGDDARFDVAATLWYSLPREDRTDVGKAETSEASEEEKVMMMYWGAPLEELQPIPKQEALLSEIIIRNASFKDKNLHRRLQYKLPLDRFRQSNSTIVDIRATFVLLPLNSARFDSIANFSDWRADDVQMPPSLPASSPALNRYAPDSIQNELLQRWAVSTTLLRFYNSPAPCIPVDQPAQVNDSDSHVTSADTAESSLVEGVEGDGEAETTTIQKLQPFVSTRSHVLVIKENRPYNLTSFSKKHSNLRKNSCKSFASNLPRHYRFCSKTYPDVGEFGLQVEIDSADGGRETGYLPFIGALPNAAGPKDLLRLPVNRKECAPSQNTTLADQYPEEPTHLDVSWDVQFSAISAGRVNLLTGFASADPQPLEANATEHEVLIAQDAWEQQVGLIGHRAPGAHHWTRFLTSVASTLPVLITHLLDSLYWYTRTSLVGLDIWASACAAAAIFLEPVSATLFDTDRTFQTGSVIVRVSLGLLFIWAIIPALLMLRAISPVSVTWNTWMSVNIERSRLSHRERASKRVASKLTPLIKSSLIAVIWAGIFLISYFDLDIYIVTPAAPNPTKRGLAEEVAHSLEFGLSISGTLFQAIMNHRCATFAGRFRLAAFISAFTSVLWVVRLSPSVVGKRNPIHGWTALESLTLMGSLWSAYQAAVLPSVKQDVIDDEEE